MAQPTNIEWATRTWNPTVGCSVISPGCKRCYAMRMANRLEGAGITQYAGTTRKTEAGAVWTGVVREAPAHVMMAPTTWKKPQKIFVNSMSDLFHEDFSDGMISTVFGVMAMCPQHIFQVLTKRDGRMLQWCRRYLPEPLPNVWLGVSVEDKARTARIDTLRQTPAAVRFVSAEPLLEDISDLISLLLRDIDWFICGGETGPNFRSMNPNWVRKLLSICVANRVAFFTKQMSGRDPIPADLMVREFPKSREVMAA